MSRWTPNRILAEPATVQACQADRLDPEHRAEAERQARDQLAAAVQHATEAATAPGSHLH
ncbi:MULTISPECIES: hypothetical protein [Streptomyces]|uniref:hypothetical protein n=1 Tax=Streptomyces TaxID=1883 RepID=UPI00073DD706|nr:hypothetical protein [Streptomyces sp. FBKL.4005]MYU28634.1 hypothetical protein [Streptomyces sp. SID7810]OYP17033.1 hypothetical protein CFC35_23080 [Streptomyces sp. FBKL.4005]CUW29673.1 hypothetical protein TUE45_04382 [Streptomyces reticuli]